MCGLTPVSVQKLQSWRKLSSLFPREEWRERERIIPTLLGPLRIGRVVFKGGRFSHQPGHF